MKQYPVVHFEMGGDDMDRMKKFYENAFGWQMNQMGNEFGNYIVVMTAPSDKGGPLERARINGGFYKRSSDPASVPPSVVVAVDNIQEAMQRVKDAGGEIIGGGNKKGEPDDIPGVGLFISVKDTEGNRISLIQPTNPGMPGM